MIKKAHIFHHNDLDGRFAAFYMYQYIKRYMKQYRKTEFYEIDYAKEIDLEKIYDCDIIVFVDYSFTNPQNIEQLNKAIDQGKNIIWIDHHQSSIDMVYKDFNCFPGYESNFKSLNLYIDNTYSATKLVWFWCKSRIEGRTGADNFLGEKAPKLVEYVNAYDLFHLDSMPNTEEFNYGMGVSRYTPKWLYADIFGSKFNNYNIFDETDKRVEKYFDKYISSKIIAGSYIKKDRETQYGYFLGGMSFEVTIVALYNKSEEPVYLKGIVMNVHSNSMAFLDKYNEYDFVSPFYLTKDGIWKYSLFSHRDDVELNKVVEAIGKCKKFKPISAGGHKKACGMLLGELIYKPNATIFIEVKKTIFGEEKVMVQIR